MLFGVPQGSYLINRYSSSRTCSANVDVELEILLVQHADDTALIAVISFTDSRLHVEHSLNRDLDIIYY